MSKSLVEALDIVFDSNEFDGVTVREFLRRLLDRLWDEQDCFRAKKPFGYSDWADPVYQALGRAGYFGSMDADGYVEYDEAEASALLRKMIHVAFYGESPE